MSVKGRRIAVPPFSEVSFPQAQHLKKEIGVRFNSRTVRICLLIDKLFSKAISAFLT